MSVAIAPARPPFVEFKRVAMHDKAASEAAGYRKTKDVDFAFIMQPGSKDVHEKEAVDWLESIKNKGINGAADAFPQEWITGFHNKYKAWKEGQEAPLNGTSVKEWPLLSPAQAENFITLRVLTIEDVASMTEEAMARYGMGCRELREKAQEWVGKQSGVAKIEAENADLKAQLAALSERMAAMEQKPIGHVTEAPQKLDAQPHDDLAELRQRYAAKFGKAPHHKKSADTLKADLEAA